MRTRTKRFMGYCIVAMTAVFFSAFMLSQFASGASRQEESIVNMGAILDSLLSPKAIDAIEPLSQWTGRTIVTSDNNTSLPEIFAPVFCDTSGSPGVDDTIYYVLNPTLESAFGSVVYESITYPYWESITSPYYVLNPEDLPFDVLLPFGDFIYDAPQAIAINALTGLWGSYSIYTIGDAQRIYYDIACSTPVYLSTNILPDTDVDFNATPDDIESLVSDAVIWTGQSDHRHVIGADLNFPDDIQTPGQPKDTARLIPEQGITVDVPITYAFYDAVLATPPERVVAMLQIADSIYDAADIQASGKKSLLGSLPGVPLIEDAFLSLHYFKGESTLQPIQEITPLVTTLEIQGLSSLKAANPLYERLALWRFPLSLNVTTGQYIEPLDGVFALANADNVNLVDGTFSAEVSQDGLLVPLRTELWLDTPFSYVLAANSEIAQPIFLKGIFPTWMGAVPESGVLPAEASARYAVTTGETELSFRTPDIDIDGFDASYAISPITNSQTPNEMYLWTAANLEANDNGLIRVSYINPDDTILAADIPVTIEDTALVSTAVQTNVAADPTPAQISLSPEQSEVVIPSGAYPLESGRYFASETIQASVVTDAGWGFVGWLLDDVEVSTETTYSFLPDSGDTTLKAEVASYALNIALSPNAEWGAITLTPSPVDGTPGYAPGTTVTIEVTPLGDALFDSWAGANASQLVVDPGASYRATIVMDSDKTIEAVLRNEVRLTVDIQPAGSGAITYSIGEEPAAALPTQGILVNIGTEVTLTATAASSEYRFIDWQIDETSAGTDASFAVTVNADTNVVANFRRVVTLALNDSPNGTVELVSPEPIECTETSEKDITYCFWEDTEVVVKSVATEPDYFVLNAWWINGLETVGTAEGFSEEYTLTLTNDTTVMADFQRKLRVDSVSLTALPVNRSIPIALTGVFPTWMGEKAFPSLTPEEAEAAYEILINDIPASFIAPENSPYTPLGEGISELDALDTEITNTAYIWSPELLELDEELTQIPVSISDRINPLNTFEIALPKEVFVTIVSLSIEKLPENTSGVVLTTPEQGEITGLEEESLSLSPGEYVAGNVVNLSAVPAYALMKYRMMTEEQTWETTAAAYDLTITDDTNVLAVFDTDAYQLTLVDSEDGIITANPLSSPGWPDGWYEEETEVTITATPNEGLRFVTWTHDLTGEIENPSPSLWTKTRNWALSTLLPLKLPLISFL